MRGRLLVGVAVGAVLASATGVAAQSDDPFRRDRNVGVRDRAHAGYEPLGLRLGAFRADARLEAGVSTTDNVFAEPQNTRSDTILSVAGTVDLRSQWSVHAVEAFAFAARDEYQDFSAESRSSWGAGVAGRLDVMRGTFLSGRLEHRRLTEPRREAGSPLNAAEPSRYDLDAASIGASHEAGRIRLSGELRRREYAYDDVALTGGGTLSQRFRDHRVDEQSVRADWAVSPALSVFTAATFNQRRYDLQPPAAATARDSDGWEAGVGADFDLTRLARGEVMVGALSQSFDDPALEDASGAAVRARVSWFVTPLTTVEFAADRSVADRGFEFAGGAVTTGASVRVDHELRRNLILFGRAAWTRDDFRGVDREDDRFEGSLGAEWRFNRHLGVRVGLDRFNRDSTEPAAEYAETRLGAALVLRY